jgi:hypothetical protein
VSETEELMMTEIGREVEAEEVEIEAGTKVETEVEKGEMVEILTIILTKV